MTIGAQVSKYASCQQYLTKGYVRVKVPGHNRANDDGYVNEQRSYQ